MTSRLGVPRFQTKFLPLAKKGKEPITILISNPAKFQRISIYIQGLGVFASLFG